MLFTSFQYVCFFAAVFAVYWLLPWHRARVWLLLAASFYFYASWNKWLALLICGSTAMDYLIARGMDGWTSQPRRRLLLVVSLVANLGLLVYFKYANFFLESLEQSLRAAGLSASLPLLQVILPVGISFYTFEAINYTVDVYRRKARAERSLPHFMLFITFFPHLVAGPIVRARDFLPQTHRAKRWSWARMQLGVEYLLLGLVKKLAIADRLAVFADPVFADPAAFATGTLWLATAAYALQIYCDFSGYTDIALGSAHLLGYKLAQNFNMPYIARNVSEFWHRWHISLSSWLRDYLFIPLGGSRGTEAQTRRNLMATMMLGGLWHGANWTFVLWGTLHGGFLVIHRSFHRFVKPRPQIDRVLQTVPGTVLCCGLTLVAVCLAWVLFRCQTLSSAGTMLGRMLWPHAGREVPGAGAALAILGAGVALAHYLGTGDRWRRLAVRLPGPVLGCGYAVFFLAALVAAPDSGKTFIYFQF
jgi:alginate O-acetyltransferase complex protein AlgI